MEDRGPPRIPGSNRVTTLLRRARAGDRRALDHLYPLVYEELRRIARARMRRERRGHTIQPTALVHEVYLRLVKLTRPNWRDRRHFFGVAAAIMGRHLIDHARRRGAARRGAGAAHLGLDHATAVAENRPPDLATLEAVIERLAALDARRARIVELRLFADLSVEEIAERLAISPSTVKREWAKARAWLKANLEY